MKRSKMPPRKADLKRTKKLPKVNPEKLAKKRARGKKKHAAYRRSETYRIVAERAGGQCEMVVKPMVGGTAERCPEVEGLEHHHVVYHAWRYGGNELPTDLLVLCGPHHDAMHPGKRRARSRAA